MPRALTLAMVCEAVIYAAEKNPCSLGPELNFAAKLKSSPHVLDARLRRMQHVFKQLNVKADCILADLGSGNSVNSILSLMCGAGEVHAIEMGEKRFATAQIIVDSLGLRDKIHLYNADLLKFNLPRKSIDGAFSSELLEHIVDLSALYRRLRGWLKAGGRVYARTGANGKNWLTRKKVKKMWDHVDKGYQKQRKEIISAKVPHLNADEMSILAERTRGLLANEIEEEIERFMKCGQFPVRKWLCAPRDCFTGQYVERLLDPIGTAKQIDAEGFTTKIIRCDFSSLTIVNPIKRRALEVIGQIIRVTHPLSLCVAPWLEFLSTKN